jgi:hypothetical protein
VRKLSEKQFNEMINLLKEIVKWTKFQAWGKVKDVLLDVLSNDEQKKIYHLSDGKQSSRKIEEKVSVSRSTIVKYWNDWANFNIVEPIPVKGGGLRYKKMFNLEDFGIEIPNKTK